MSKKPDHFIYLGELVRDGILELIYRIVYKGDIISEYLVKNIEEFNTIPDTFVHEGKVITTDSKYIEILYRVIKSVSPETAENRKFDYEY